MAINALTSGFSIFSLMDKNVPKLNAHKGEFPQLIAAQAPEAIPESKPDTVYATVKVNGKIVAVINNSGTAETPNATYGKVKNLPSMGEAETLTGPGLARKRAEEIAGVFGGKIEMAKSAQTQAQWESGSAAVNAPDTVRYARVNKDAEAQAKYDAQRIAQDNDNVMAEFMEIAKKSPAERIRDQILKSKGLSEEDVEAMTPEKREALEKEIAQMIEDKFREGAKKAMLNPEDALKVNKEATATAEPKNEPEVITPQSLQAAQRKKDIDMLKDALGQPAEANHTAS